MAIERVKYQTVNIIVGCLSMFIAYVGINVNVHTTYVVCMNISEYTVECYMASPTTRLRSL